MTTEQYQMGYSDGYSDGFDAGAAGGQWKPLGPGVPEYTTQGMTYRQWLVGLVVHKLIEAEHNIDMIRAVAMTARDVADAVIAEEDK